MLIDNPLNVTLAFSDGSGSKIFDPGLVGSGQPSVV